MTSLVSLAAAQTASDRDIEAPEDRPSGNLFLKLTDRLKRLQTPSTVRAGRWQRDRNDLIDLLGCGSMGVKAVVRPSLAARRLGVRLGSSLGKRSGLPLLSPSGLFQLSNGFGKLTLELRVLSAEFLNRLVAWIPGGVVGHSPRVSPEIQHRRRRKHSSYFELQCRRTNGSDSSRGRYNGLRNVAITIPIFRGVRPRVCLEALNFSPLPERPPYSRFIPLPSLDGLSPWNRRGLLVLDLQSLIESLSSPTPPIVL